MKDTRSASQIIYGFLPEQTIDLKGGIWKVREWRAPRRLNEVDSGALKSEILRQARGWETAQTDYYRFLNKLRTGIAEVEPYQIDEANGVLLDAFPKQWICKGCNLVYLTPDVICPCNSRTKGQLPFVAYHDCGEIREVSIERCPTHGEVRLEFAKSASIADLRFKCPKCNWSRQGLPFMKCSCGAPMKFNVHRAAVVYTPRSVVLVNPPLSEARRRLENAGGSARALTWFFGGMKEKSALETAETQSSLASDLLTRGLPPEVVERIVAASGLPAGETAIPELPIDLRAECESQAMKLALATLDSRLRTEDLAAAIAADHELSVQYRAKYPEAMQSAGLASIELIERFPIFTGHYGYTRGDHDPSKSTLRPFRHHDRSRRNVFPVYGDLAQTEALLVRLNPQRVAEWLRLKGHDIHAATSTESTYAAILVAAADAASGESVRSDILHLVHSYSHRFIRTVAIYAGIDRNALSELVLDSMLSFVVYAVPRGDFVLGGLHAVFERELDTLLAEVVHGEHRCPLDPGCSKGKSACMACLHLGEPSCRLFNTHLSRKALFGTGGYFSLPPNPRSTRSAAGANT